jgi:hypothetical protein
MIISLETFSEKIQGRIVAADGYQWIHACNNIDTYQHFIFITTNGRDAIDLLHIPDLILKS